MAYRYMQGPLAKRLQGKVALITGAASGIGAATARLFVRHGAKVVMADVQDSLGHSLGNELGLDENAFFIHCDVTEETDVKNAVDTTISKYGKLDIMFNNAGIIGNPKAQIVNSTKEDFKRVFDINGYGAFLGAKHAARVMIPAKKGTIIFTASTSSVIGNEQVVYTMSKHAVVGLSRSLCVELGEHGIRVNCVSPYGVATSMVRNATGITEKQVEEVFSSSANLQGVTLKADDIAEAVLYLSSDEAKYVSGLNLMVDGGYTTSNPSAAMSMKATMKNTT